MTLFTSTEWEGEARETAEMQPRWFKIAEAPFSNMFPDDVFWFPLLLSGKPFVGEFVCPDEDTVLYIEMQVVESFGSSQPVLGHL